jgi:hypothetical protein
MSPWPEGVPDEIVNDEDVAPPCLRSEPLDSVWR